MLTLRRACARPALPIRVAISPLLVALVLVAAHSERAAAAPTFVSGANYTVDKTWTRADSPYVLNGDVTAELRPSA